MTQWTLAHDSRESAAVRTAVRDHARIRQSLGDHVESLLLAVEEEPDAVPELRRRLVSLGETVLLPHADAEERSIYPVAATDARTRLLLEAMVEEHRTIAELVSVVKHAVHPIRAAAAAEALRVLVETHLAKEDTIVFPLVASTPGLSLETLVAGMHDLLPMAARRPHRA
jgi:iron-sulfur cluster repair protein YtfE (RIC family)